MDANTTALVCVSCLKPARYVCKKCYDIFIGPDKKPGMRHRLDHVGRYCSRECQINHWILIHAATHDIWDRAEESAVGGSIDSYPLPACTTLHKRPKSDPERDIEEQTRLLGDTLAFFRDKLEDLSVVLWNTPTLKAGGSFDRPDIRSAMWAMANVPLLLRESDARAAKKPMDEGSQNEPCIFF